MAGAMLLGYLSWVIVREIYIRVAIWAEERDEGVFFKLTYLACKKCFLDSPAYFRRSFVNCLVLKHPCLAYLRKIGNNIFAYCNVLLAKKCVCFAKRVENVFNICFSGHTLAHLLTEVGGDPWCPNPSAQMGCYPAA